MYNKKSKFFSTYSTIGTNIIRLRGGMSQGKLAKKAGVSRSTINAIEKGKPISLENLLKIAKALNINPADLFISDTDREEISHKHKLLFELISESLGLKKIKEG